VKHTRLLLLALLLPLVGIAAIPQDSISVASAAESTSGLGASIDITYEVGDKIFSRQTDLYMTGFDYYLTYYQRAYMMADDGDYFQYTVRSDSTHTTKELILLVEFDSPYSEVATLEYDLQFQAEGDHNAEAGNLYVYTETSRANVNFANELTWYDGTVTLDNTYVVGSKVYVELYASSTDNDGSPGENTGLVWLIDELRLTYDTLTETRRSSYSLIGGTLKHTVDWTTWDYNVNTTLTVPNAGGSVWTFRDVNPDAGVTSNEFACLVPEDYQAIYTEDVLATANWELAWSDSFENGISDMWLYYGLESDDTITLDYTNVLDGSVSLREYCEAYEGVDGRLPSSVYSTVGEAWVVYSVFCESGNIQISVWDEDAGAWVSDNFGTGGDWETRVLHVPNLGSRILLRSYSTSGIAYWDNIQIFNSSITQGKTITGQLNHIHPNGYAGASYVDVELGLWDANPYWQEYYTVTTGSDGSWSLDTADFSTSFSSQTYRLWSWVYTDANGEWDTDAKTESTTDWTMASSTLTTSTDAQEGLYSVVGNRSIVAAQFNNLYYNPAAVFDASGIFVHQLKFQNIDKLDLLYPYIRDASNNYYYNYIHYGSIDAYKVQPFYTENSTWQYRAVPMTGDYWVAKSGTVDMTDIDYFRFSVRANDTVNYFHFMDSFNFIHYYTHDGLTYPFTLPTDWELQGSFSEGDVKAFYDYTTNYDASYTVYD